MQAGDAGDDCVTAVAQFLRLEGGEPAALLLVKARHEEVEMLMPVTVRMLGAAKALETLARMNGLVGHDKPSAAAAHLPRGGLY